MATVSSMWFVCCSLVLLSALGALSQMSCGSKTALEDYTIPQIQRRLTEGYDISHLAISAPVIRSIGPFSKAMSVSIKTVSPSQHVIFSVLEVFITERHCENWRLAVTTPARLKEVVQITNLKPNTEYNIAVRGTLLGEIYSNFSEVMSAKTGKGNPSAPRNARFSVVESGRGLITWDAPAEMNGDLKRYLLSYAFEKAMWTMVESPVANVTVDLPADARFITFFVSAENEEGEGGVEGGLGDPSPPQAFDILTNSISDNVTWQELLHDEKVKPRISVKQIQQEQITVLVEAPDHKDSQPPHMEVLVIQDSSQHWVVAANIRNKSIEHVRITGLRPYTRYHLACAVPPTHTFSEVVEVTTLPAPPSVVRNVSYRCRGSEEVQVHWEEPEDANGEIAVYRVGYYIHGSSTAWELIFTHEVQTTIHVPPRTKFLTFWVTAHTAPNRNGLGGGNSHYTPNQLVQMERLLCRRGRHADRWFGV